MEIAYIFIGVCSLTTAAVAGADLGVRKAIRPVLLVLLSMIAGVFISHMPSIYDDTKMPYWAAYLLWGVPFIILLLIWIGIEIYEAGKRKAYNGRS
jgi:hypothetical protein